MSSTPPDPAEADWRAALEALQQLHRRLLAKAEELRVLMARPAACWVVGGAPGAPEVRLGPGRLEQPERVALYESLCADIHVLEQLIGQLEQLHGPHRGDFTSR